MSGLSGRSEETITPRARYVALPVGTAAAITNAVYNATGIRDLPITPDKLLR